MGRWLRWVGSCCVVAGLASQGCGGDDGGGGAPSPTFGSGGSSSGGTSGGTGATAGGGTGGTGGSSGGTAKGSLRVCTGGPQIELPDINVKVRYVGGKLYVRRSEPNMAPLLERFGKSTLSDKSCSFFADTTFTKMQNVDAFDVDASGRLYVFQNMNGLTVYDSTMKVQSTCNDMALPFGMPELSVTADGAIYFLDWEAPDQNILYKVALSGSSCSVSTVPVAFDPRFVLDFVALPDKLLVGSLDGVFVLTPDGKTTVGPLAYDLDPTAPIAPQGLVPTAIGFDLVDPNSWALFQYQADGKLAAKLSAESLAGAPKGLQLWQMIAAENGRIALGVPSGSTTVQTFFITGL